jgi:hypothetical protein
MATRVLLSTPILVRLRWRTIGRTMSTTALPLEPPSVEHEQALFDERSSQISQFFASPRYANIKRPYAPSDIASKQGSLPVLPSPTSLLSDKLFNLLGKAAAEGRPIHTMGAIDPIQMTQMAKFQEVLYVSGWACSSVLTTANNEVGPDLACVTDTAEVVESKLIPNLEIIPTPRFPTKFIVYSVPNNYMTRSIMTNVCLLLWRNVPSCHTSTIFDR